MFIVPISVILDHLAKIGKILLELTGPGRYAIRDSIGFNELPDRLDEIDKEKIVVTACPHKDRAILGRLFLALNGYQSYNVNLALALPVSFLAGLVSGLVGIGGGILKVPLMVLLLGIPMDIAVGSSALMVGLTAAGGFAGHLVAGHWDWRTSLVLAVAVFIGGQIGARRAITINKHKMKRGFGWFLLLIAVTMVGKIYYSQIMVWGSRLFG